jgi:hypothetical protein
MDTQGNRIGGEVLENIVRYVITSLLAQISQFAKVVPVWHSTN